MELGYILYGLGIILLLAYVLTMCVVVVLEILEVKHPSEAAVTRVFIKIGYVFALVVMVYLIGRMGAKVC